MLLRLLRSAFQPRSSSASQVKRALDLRAQGRLADAEAALRSVSVAHPRDAIAATNLALTLLEQDQADEAVALLERAIVCDPKCAAAHFNYANVLRVSGRLSQAIEHYRAAAASDPGFAAAPEELMHTLLEACEWDGARTIADALREKVSRQTEAEWMRFVSPLTAVYLGLDHDQCKKVAAFHSPPPAPLAHVREFAARQSPERPNARLCIGYLSRDFRDHPVGHLLCSVFSLHDRRRFEVLAFSHGPDDGSVYRKTIEGSVERFVDIAGMSDDEAARSISAARVDVLIDLMGHTTGNRLAVLARRPAPVQAHYLGYAGTTGAPYVDFFVSDAIATPMQLESAFSEQIARVPDCFMVSDGSEALNAVGSSRAEQHLPDHAYVFCNFGNASRITRETFSLWMEVLQRVPESVLWLKGSHDLVMDNLRRGARLNGVDPARLVFAQRVPDKPAHLGRLALADLALDTIGWHNGHSTTADMLWAGVPVLTSPGGTFASRVASSLVRNASIGELIAENSEDYRASAIRLGADPAATRALRTKLESQCRSAAFFDTARLVQGLETACEAMYAGKLRRSRGSVAQSVRAGDS